MRLVRTRRPAIGLLIQSGLARLADQMSAVVYGWGLFLETGNSSASALVIASSLLALCLGTLFAGRLVARFGARPVALAAAWTSVAAASAIAILFALGRADPLLIAALAALGAVVDGPAGVAAETTYPEIARLGRIDLVRFNAIDDGLDNAAGLLAPAAGAALVSGLGLFAGASALAVLGLLSALTLTISLPPFGGRLTDPHTTLAEALRHLRRDDVLFPLAILFSLVIALFLAVELVVLPRLIKDAADLGAASLPLFLLAAGSTGLLGVAMSKALAERLSLRRLVALAFLLLAIGVGLLAIDLSTAVLMLSGALVGLPGGLVSPPAASIFQSRPPRALRPDMQALAGALSFAAAPIAILVVGFVADLVEPATLILALTALIVVLAAATAILPPRLSLRQAMRSPIEADPLAPSSS